MGILVTERGAIGFSSFGVLLREFSFIPYAVTGHGRGRVCVRVELDVAGEDQPVGHRGRWRCWRRGPDRHPTRPSLAFAAVLVLPIPSMP
jgi:hypothetical protein